MIVFSLGTQCLASLSLVNFAYLLLRFKVDEAGAWTNNSKRKSPNSVFNLKLQIKHGCKFLSRKGTLHYIATLLFCAAFYSSELETTEIHMNYKIPYENH